MIYLKCSRLKEKWDQDLSHFCHVNFYMSFKNLGVDVNQAVEKVGIKGHSPGEKKYIWELLVLKWSLKL